MKPINEKNLKIRDQVFKGDLGAEQKLQNDAIMAILLRQDAIVEAMTPTAKAKYDEATAEHREFLDNIKDTALKTYRNIKEIR